MKVPFLDLKANYNSIKSEILEAIDQVLENTAYILGKSVKDFEAAFAKDHQAEFCIGVSSGTDGNHLALWSLGIGQGDEVIIPANTFIATAWGATLCGATPVFVDCDPLTYNLDPKKIEAAITPRTKAIVAVHLYGQPADLEAINEVATKHNLILVEDCAQSHIAEYKGKRVGTFGKISSFSFYPGKNLGAYGEGGAVVTNDQDLAKKCKMLREHGSEQKYYHKILGHNYRMEGIQGAVLGVKLKHLEKWTEMRRSVAQKYNSLFSECTEITTPFEADYSKHVYHLYVVKVDSEKRDKLVNFLAENGISTGLHYPVPLHLQECFSSLGYKKGDFPVTEELAESAISLPMYPEMTDEQIEYVASTLISFFN